MADTMVEWLTGQTHATDVNVEIQILMPLDSLTDPHNTRTATVAGAGPLPGPLAREIITSKAGSCGGDCSPPPTRPAGGRSSAATRSGAGSTAGSPN
jgi:hypothetical protein